MITPTTILIYALLLWAAISILILWLYPDALSQRSIWKRTLFCFNTTTTIENILYRKEIRKGKGKWFTPYYNREDWSLKEKLYAFWFKMDESGFTTTGESNWTLTMLDADRSNFHKLEAEFKIDYTAYLTDPTNPK